MTHEEIDKLEAGRELDYLISQAIGFFTGPLDEETKQYAIESGAVWFYSTSIEDAWGVPEKLEKHPDEILFKITRLGTSSSDLHWLAEFRRCQGAYQGRHDWAEADTAPLAICRAALKAIGA